MEKLVTIATFTYPHEMAIIRGKLESENIECFVKDEFTVQVNNFYSNAIGGVKLQVRETDLQEARDILKDLAVNKKEEVGVWPRPLLNKKNECLCPHCGSDNVSKQRLSLKTIAITILLLGFPIPFIKRKYYCYSCEKEFSRKT